MNSPDDLKLTPEATAKPAAKPRSFLATLGAVFWSFAGLRSKQDAEQDATGLNPVYVIVAGLLGVAMLIAVLIIIVKLVVP